MRRRGATFCCCAFPLVKFGAYLLVAESAFVGLCIGLLALVPPRIVGCMGSVPEWSKDLVAAVAFVAVAWQILGLVSVILDRPSLYRLYIRINFFATVIMLIITIAFLITAAARHNESVDACLREFERPLGSDVGGIVQVRDQLQNGRHQVCNVLSWVDVGLMGAMIVIIGLMQLYMNFMQRQYGVRQRFAIQEKDEGYASQNSIPLAQRSTSGRWRGGQSYAPLHAH
ncbi:hypothetical protein MVES_002550 [Malassezia vespertilionis]|uniref:Uncharacterized protein n=1 Tax=Malassezia vespertilionis TaxID=2020962 RepID=A0A2N1J9Y0_9BASI|nr:hypothetical protein MVES_002550 [Malassezia vespertilionis]